MHDHWKNHSLDQMDLCWQSNVSAFQYAIQVGHNFALKNDLNQIPYDYTVEVRNRFKGLDLIDRVPDELQTEVRDIVQETRIKTIPKKKK